MASLRRRTPPNAAARSITETAARMVDFQASHGVLDAASEPAMDSEYTLGQRSALETVAGSD